MSEAAKSEREAKPPAKTSIAPMLSVRNGVKALEFYKAAFGAEELFKIENGGSVVATLSVDGAEFWVADESPEHANFSPESLGGGSVRVSEGCADLLYDSGFAADVIWRAVIFPRRSLPNADSLAYRESR